MKKSAFTFAFTFAFAFAFAGCAGRESVSVMLPVLVSNEGLVPVTTDLGYVVTLTQFRVAAKNLQFTVSGEAHEHMATRVRRWFLSDAHAHPGHLAGGAVTGELAGNLVLDFAKADASLGMATLLSGTYEGANLTFRTAEATDLPSGDPLIGHSVYLAGSAAKDGRTAAFTAAIDQFEDTVIVGLPFSLVVKAETKATIVVEGLTTDPFEGDSLFQGLDFFVLDTDQDNTISISPGTDGHNLLRRTTQLHDQYEVVYR